MEVLTSPAEMNSWAREQVRSGQKTALVPTMGYFHEGHLRLMRMAAKEADKRVVSLFVNPMQFGPGEDLARYPRNIDRDASLAEKEGVDILFLPQAEDMYPQGFQTTVSVNTLSRYLCGISRPDHFSGVTTVVCKLFHIIRPDCAVFGQKDFQQLAIIRRMVEDLNMGIEIFGHPIVREEDGLAMSSRNTYLNDRQRAAALSLSKGIALARSLYKKGERDTALLVDAISQYILSYADTAIDYVRLVDTVTLETVGKADHKTMLLLAVHIANRVRLIDNGLLSAIA